MIEYAREGDAKGRRVGRPVLVDRDKLEYAAHLRDQGDTIAEIGTKTGIPRTSLYRHLPPRPRASGHRGWQPGRGARRRGVTKRPDEPPE